LRRWPPLDEYSTQGSLRRQPRRRIETRSPACTRAAAVIAVSPLAAPVVLLRALELPTIAVSSANRPGLAHSHSAPSARAGVARPAHAPEEEHYRP